MDSKPCCAPTLAKLELHKACKIATSERMRVYRGSIAEMSCVPGGVFFMGSAREDSLPEDGEVPVRKVFVDSYYISKYAVTNAQFSEFTRKTGYRTDAERFGWSFVHQTHSPHGMAVVADTPWWIKVLGANWREPLGPIAGTFPDDHEPVVHVSWCDAQAYCSWGGFRLPSEAEWEAAARGGLEQKIYPWGDELLPEGNHKCNIWQGKFPSNDLGEDGYTRPAPVHSFEANGYGLFNAVGNVWEWCNDYFDVSWHRQANTNNPVGPPTGLGRVMKGGSYLCHSSYCFRYRNSSRTFNREGTTTGNIGFRVVRDLANVS